MTEPTDRERELMAEVALWRSRALDAWEQQAAQAPGITELLALRQSLSWRVTRPLRVLRGRRLRG